VGRVRINHCCSEKATSVAYSECLSAALGIQHAMRVGHIVICGLLGSKILLQIISQTARFSDKTNKQKKVIEHKMCVLIFSATSV
jgi:hypothetical protein